MSARLFRLAWAEVDLAPVCLFRALYGVLLLLWFVQLAPDLHAFFSETGMLPRAQLLTGDAGRFSLLYAVSYDWQLWLCWLASVGVAVMLAAGYRTRLMCLLAFIAVLSFESRNPLILDGSDFVYRLVPCWLIFTAAGNRYSIDAWLRARQGEAPCRKGPALPITLLQMQLAWIYLATALEKVTGPSWINGTALAYVLRLSHTYARPFVAPLASSSLLVHLATWATFSLEIQFFFVVFLGILGRRAKYALIVGAALLHLGILSMMNVGNFPLIMLAALIVYLPPAFVERLVSAASRVFDRIALAPRVLNWAMSVTSRTWRGPVESLLSRRPSGSVSQAHFVLTSDSERTGRDRRTAGQTGVRLGRGIALAFVAVMALSTSLPSWLAALHPPEGVDQALAYTGLKQQWDMFAPDPTRTDGWITGPGWLEDGTRVDVVSGGVASDAPRFANLFSSRWGKVGERMKNDDYAGYRADFARMYCRNYNESRPASRPRLITFELISVERTVAMTDVAASAMTERTFWTQAC